MSPLAVTAEDLAGAALIDLVRLLELLSAELEARGLRKADDYVAEAALELEAEIEAASEGDGEDTGGG